MPPVYPTYGAISSSSRTLGRIRQSHAFNDRGTTQRSLRRQLLVAGQTTVRYGGLGLRTAIDLALPAFLSARAASNSLVNDILISQLTRHRTTWRIELDWTKISIYLPTLTSKEIGTIFSALASFVLFQDGFAFRVWRLPDLHPQQQSRQRHSPYRRRSPHRTLSPYSSLTQMQDNCGRIRHTSFYLPLHRRAHTSPFRTKRRRSTRPFCCQDTVHARTVRS